MSYDPQQYNPYNAPSQPPRPGEAYNPYGPKPTGGSGMTWLWILLGGGGLMFLVCCGSCCGLGYWAMVDEERQLQAMFEQHPQVVEHIGPVTSFQRDWGASLDEDDDAIWHYTITGEKGDGVIIVHEGPLDINSEEPDVDSATLRLPTGEEFEIYP